MMMIYTDCYYEPKIQGEHNIACLGISGICFLICAQCTVDWQPARKETVSDRWWKPNRNEKREKIQRFSLKSTQQPTGYTCYVIYQMLLMSEPL